MAWRIKDWIAGHWQLLAITAVVVALWNTPVVLPLKILVVFFHEMSHGLAAVLTGGAIVSISLTPDQGGVAVTRGGNLALILSAGYLGSLLSGVALLLAGLWSRADRAVIAGLGVIVLAITLLYMRGLFPLGFGLATAAALFAVARFLPNEVNDLVLRIIGLTSIIYVPRDIVSDTIARAHLRSDAFMLAEHLGGTPQIWGGLWLVISAVVIAWCLRSCLAQDSNITFLSK